MITPTPRRAPEALFLQAALAETEDERAEAWEAVIEWTKTFNGIRRAGDTYEVPHTHPPYQGTARVMRFDPFLIAQ